MMPWEKLEDVPEEVKTHKEARLTLEQANAWAKIYDALLKRKDVDNPAALAWATWERNYKKSEEGKRWVRVTPEELFQFSECEEPNCLADSELHTIELQEGRTTEVLMLEGTAIAAGTWKGKEFSAEVLKKAINNLSNKRIDVEHEDESWEDVRGFNYRPRWNDTINGIDVSAAVFDEKVIDWFKKNPNEKIGFSVKLSDKAEFNDDKCSLFDVKGIALTLNPACKVCWINKSEVVKLSNETVDETTGVKKMAKEKEKPEDEDLSSEEEEEREECSCEEEEDKKLSKGEKKEDKPEEHDEEREPEEKPKPEPSTDVTALNDKLKALNGRIQELEKANEKLENEKSLSEAKRTVDALILEGKLPEAKRKDATELVLSLGEDEAEKFMSVIGSKGWKKAEQGLVLSEEEDDEPEEFSNEFCLT